METSRPTTPEILEILYRKRGKQKQQNNMTEEYDDFMDGLEKAILGGMTEQNGEEVLNISQSAEKVVDYLEKMGIIVFYNET